MIFLALNLPEAVLTTKRPENNLGLFLSSARFSVWFFNICENGEGCELSKIDIIFFNRNKNH